MPSFFVYNQIGFLANPRRLLNDDMPKGIYIISPLVTCLCNCSIVVMQQLATSFWFRYYCCRVLLAVVVPIPHCFLLLVTLKIEAECSGSVEAALFEVVGKFNEVLTVCVSDSFTPLSYRFYVIVHALIAPAKNKGRKHYSKEYG